MKKLMLPLSCLCAVLLTLQHIQQKDTTEETHKMPSQDYKKSANEIEPSAASLFAQGKSDTWITDNGRVTKILPDDNKGSRHQRFIVITDEGASLLIAHNIDLAERVADLRIGDGVTFRGEYEWNEQGGVLHWTHKDPDRRLPGGWIQHNGRSYR